MNDSQYFAFSEEASIVIEIDENTNILCIAPPGAKLTTACWQLRKQVRAQDSNFAGYPYTRTLWPINPATNLPDKTPSFKASDATTYTFT
jgi:hypothetical protein